MEIHTLTPDDALKAMLTTASGLTGAEAERRLSEFGPNRLGRAAGRPLYRRVLAQLTHLLALLLWLAAGLCFISNALSPGEGMGTLGIAVVAVIFVNAAFSLVQEYRAERALDALRNMLPARAKVMRDGETVEVGADGVVPGDIMLVCEGDKIPADARLVESTRLMVNNAPLTGESEPQPRDAEAFRGDFFRSANIVFAGTLALSGSGRAVVFATGAATEFGRIADMTQTVEPGLTPLQKEIKRVTRIVAAVALAAGAAFFMLGLAVGMGFSHNFMFAVGIIIANVPEGLLPTVTLSLAMGARRMAARKALVKDLNSVETLGSVTVICTDKTGTLTMNKMEAVREWTLSRDAVRMLWTAALLCNDASQSGDTVRGDPTETALLKAALERTGGVGSKRLAELPFDPVRKMMTTVNELDGARCVITKGAPERVLERCVMAAGGGDAVPLDDTSREEVRAAYATMMADGLRVLAFAYKEGREGEAEGELEAGLTFLGLVGLEDPVRPGAADAVARCLKAGIRVLMITGDSAETASAVARKAGISDSPRAVEGEAVERMPDDELRKFLRGGAEVYARMTPADKLRVVALLQDDGERVAVTGDGVNDAPALKKADIGVAMGESGTDVAREAADLVLLDDNFATIVAAVEEGRTILGNIRKFIAYIFAHLTPEAVPYALFSVFNIPLPLTVMQIIAIDLGTETVPALALGAEPPEEGPLAAPGPGGRRIIDAGLLVRSYLFLGLISAAGALALYFYVLYQGGWRWGAVLPMGDPLARRAATATFLGIVIMQVGTVFACRSEGRSVFRLGLFSNRLVLAGISVELALAALIIYTRFGNEIFGTLPVGAEVWGMAFLFGAALLAADEVRKGLGVRC